MPVWNIKHSPNVFSTAEKEQLAKSITRLYISYELPAFYVEVHFIESAPGNLFIGGEQPLKFAAVAINHVARTLTTDEQKQQFLSGVDAVLNPVFRPKGLQWEYFIVESTKDLWKMNGLVPPEAGSEGEREWSRLNKAVAF